MSTSARFLKSQAGMQATFETAVTPTFTLPFAGEYEDAGDFNEAELDDGRWIPSKIIDRVSNYATFRLRGAAFFEMLPILNNAMFAYTAPVGAGAPFAYNYELDLTVPGTPRPYTFMFGGGEDLGATGPAVRIADCYCQSYVLSGNMNDRSVSLESNWFGAGVDDNSGAGYDFAAVAMPSPLGMLRFPYSTLEYEDATTTGSGFTTMTAMNCRLMDWRLSVNGGLRAQWSADANQLTMCGVFIDTPSIQLEATIRTDATTYAAVRGKAESQTYQELQFTLTGASSRAAIFQMTGRWLPVTNVHARSNGEVVMTGTFDSGGYPSQTTTPHAFGYQIATAWSHASP